jgi:hypothetical protein
MPTTKDVFNKIYVTCLMLASPLLASRYRDFAWPPLFSVQDQYDCMLLNSFSLFRLGYFTYFSCLVYCTQFVHFAFFFRGYTVEMFEFCNVSTNTEIRLSWFGLAIHVGLMISITAHFWAQQLYQSASPCIEQPVRILVTVFLCSMEAWKRKTANFSCFIILYNVCGLQSHYDANCTYSVGGTWPLYFTGTLLVTSDHQYVTC